MPTRAVCDFFQRDLSIAYRRHPMGISFPREGISYPAQGEMKEICYGYKKCKYGVIGDAALFVWSEFRGIEDIYIFTETLI